MRSFREAAQALGLSLETGLSTEQVEKSRRQFGSNRLTPLAREPLWRKFLGRFDEPIIKVLLAAALLSMVVVLFKPPGDPLRFTVTGSALAILVLTTGLLHAAGKGHWVPSILFVGALLLWPIGPLTGGAVAVDGLAVMVAVILATGIAFASEYKSDREFELLNADKETVRVKLLRDGGFRTAGLEEVVVGDVVRLEIGDEVPADGVLASTTNLFIDQSLMTGESEPVPKQPQNAEEMPDDAACLFRGTYAVDGSGTMVVTEVGDATYLGRIAQQLEGEHVKVETTGEHQRVQQKLAASRELTPLQFKLEVLAGQISKAGYLAAGAIFAVLVVRSLISGDIHWPRAGEEPGAIMLANASHLLGYFMYMVIIIVVAVPEGLPMSVTVSLALAMRKMTRSHSLVRQLVACETIGSATVICLDKTGTLTQNRMQVAFFSWDGTAYEPGPGVPPAPDSRRPWPRDGEPLDWIALNAAVNSTANLEEKNGKLLAVGNSTEAALLRWLREAGVDYAHLRRQFPPICQCHFTSETKRMTSACRYGERVVALVKGAPEWVLDHSTKLHGSDGLSRDWSAADRHRIEEQLQAATKNAMRTLAFAYAIMPAEKPGASEPLGRRLAELESTLVYVGFAGIHDPLRSDAREAVMQCRQAGIAVKMITGDSVETARAIGREVGLLEDNRARVLTSHEIDSLSDAALKELLPELCILARATPLDKLRIVKLLQEQGEVVAVTGDGTNDAPALKRADVGLAMGITGTAVAKEASKIILLDDAFSTIVKAVAWGRSLYENIQRFIQFQLTINVSALTIAILGPLLFDIEPPFTILQLLWINVVMDTLASIALCSEPPRPGILRMPPKHRDESIVTPSMLWTIFTTALFFVVVMMGLLLGMKHSGWFASSETVARESMPFTHRQVTIFFTVYIMFQLWNEINCRSLVPEVSGLAGLFRNRVFLALVGMIAVVQVMIVTFGGQVFNVEPLPVMDWIVITAATASVLVFAELARRLRLIAAG
jgi:Ca2+-transporting ATPase